MTRHHRRGRGAAAAVALLAALGAGAHLAAPQTGPVPKPSQAESPPLSGGQLAPGLATPNERDPAIYADGTGRVYRVWIEERPGKERHERGIGGVVRLARSADGGLTWSAPLMVPDRAEGGQAIEPRLAFDARGGVLAVWRTKVRTPTGRFVRFQRSADLGATWAPESRDLNRDAAGFDPQIELGPDGQVYVAWTDERAGVKPRTFDIFFTRSPDLGGAWEPETRVNPPWGGPGPAAAATVNFRPRLLAGRDATVYLSWIGIGARGGSSLYFRRSPDRGKSWEEPVDIGRQGSSTGNQTLLRGADDQLFAVWQASRSSGPVSAYFSRSDDGGRRWLETPVKLARLPEGSLAQSVFPEMARGPKGELYVAWQDNRNGRDDIYLTRSLDGGRSWLPQDVRLDQDDAGTGVSRAPRIAVSAAGTVAVAWEDDRQGFPGLYVALSFDGGQRWRETRVDQDAPPRTGVRGIQLAWGPGEVLHLFWGQEKRLGISEVEKSLRYRRLAITRP